MLRCDDSVIRLAVEASPTGIAVCDERGMVVFVNRQAEHILGSEADALVARPIGDLLPSALMYARQRAEEDVGAAELHRVRDICRRTDGSDVALEVGWIAVSAAAGRLFIAFMTEVSEQQDPPGRHLDPSTANPRLERVVTDLAARFVLLPPEHVDRAITDGLRDISETLDLDRSTWWRVRPDSGDLVVASTWTREEYRGMQSSDSARGLVPWLVARLEKGDTFSFSDADEIPSAADREGFQRFGTKSGAAVPFLENGQLRALLGFSAVRRPYQWSPEVLERLRLVAAIFGQALMRTEGEKRFRSALAEVRHLRRELAIESVQLQHAARTSSLPQAVVAESAAAKRVLEQLESVASTAATVLLLGETGTGKEVFAQAIHRASDRHARPMVTVNCGAIPATLIESELFGRERGAFTGALARQIGRFEMAHESTILLDEIGDLPLDLQVKLLRVLQERVVERLGSNEPVKINVRVIAATNRNLERAVEDHTFREDLFYRLNVFPITIPPLRERLEDIPALVWTFIEEFSGLFHRRIDSIAKESLRALQQHAWPGNVRELRNVIERAMIVAKSPRLVVQLPPPPAAAASPNSTRLDDVQSEQIRRVLESVGWRVRGPAGAAELLGIKPNTLDSRMAKLGIRREPRRRAE